MGNPLAKAGLTDLSARIALETRFDVYLYRRFGEKKQKIITHIQTVGGKRKPMRREFTLRSLEEFFRLYRSLRDLGLTLGVANLVKLTKIDPTKPINPPSSGPVIAMLNGDDNFRGNPSYGTTRACVNTEKRGQVIEKSKTASSRRYITYCQSPGYTPWSQLVQIVYDHAGRLTLEGKDRWSYPCGVESTYITRDDIRSKLLNQASKGGRDRGIMACDTSVTGRSSLLSKESSYMPPLKRAKLHFLHRLAYPQWYTNIDAIERLPAALGGLDSQDYIQSNVVWDQLSLKHKKLVKLMLDPEDPLLAIAAGKTLNRAKPTAKDVSIEHEELRHAKGLELVELWNSLTEEEVDKVQIFSYDEARTYAIESIANESQKSISLISGTTNGTECTDTSVSRTTTQVAKKIQRSFTRLDKIDQTFEHLPYILSVIEEKAKRPPPPDPKKGVRKCIERIRKTKLVNDDNEEIEPPEGKFPYQWLYGAVHGRKARKYILAGDYERIKPPRTLSTKVLPGTTYGLRSSEVRTSHVHKYKKHYNAKTKSEAKASFLEGLRNDIRTTYMDRISEISDARSISSLVSASLHSGQLEWGDIDDF
jgi:hypothetical protein